MQFRICRTCLKQKQVKYFRDNRTECRDCGNEKYSQNKWFKKYGENGNPANIDLDGEIWKDVKGWSGYYLVSNKKRIKSLVKGMGNEKIKSQTISTSGYWCVHLKRGDRIGFYRVHRAMAFAFIPNPYNLPCINHKDGNKLNNELDNLEWSTYGDNIRHAYDLGLNIPRYGEKSSNAKLTSVQVLEIFNSIEASKVLSKKYDVTPCAINCIRSGRSWGHLTGKFHPTFYRKEKIWKELHCNIEIA